MGKLIPVGKGLFATVDDEDWDDLIRHEWYQNNDGYAVRNVRIPTEDGKGFRRTIIKMHQVIAKKMKLIIPKGYEIDHFDQNPLNNCRDNLRIVTHSQNRQNAKLNKNNTSGIKGIIWHEQQQRYSAWYVYNGERIHLGSFVNKEDAIKARKAAEEKYNYNPND